MTVSRVANRDPHVLTETRRRVERAIEELGYVPNLAARSLAGGRPARIALVYSNPSASYLSELLVGALSEAVARSMQLLVEFIPDHEQPAAFAARLVSRPIEGVLLPPPLSDDADLLASLHHHGVALVQIATGQPADFAYAVTIDDVGAAYAMTCRLLDQGHRRIGFITGDANQTASALRRAGYLRAIEEVGLPVRPDLIVQGDFTYRSGWRATERLLALPEPPSAIFASNDDMAAAAVSVAHRAGLAVPGDLAICGFDDTAPATTIWPELTTIRQPVAEMARRGVAMLAEASQRQEDAPVAHERLDFELVERESDGPRPRRNINKTCAASALGESEW